MTSNDYICVCDSIFNMTSLDFPYDLLIGVDMTGLYIFSHTEKHHHKHLEYIDAGGWKKRSDEDNENTIIARNDDLKIELNEAPDQLQERSGEVELSDAKDNVKDYLRKYIDFYKSVVEPDDEVDVADDRNYYDEQFLAMSEEVDDQINNYNAGHHQQLYQPAAQEYNWEILEDDTRPLGLEGYRAAMERQEVEEEGDEDFWEPELEDLQISLYDLEPDWTPQPEVALERNGRSE